MSNLSEERVALITGAGRGIGAAAAELLANRSWRVGLVSRTPSELADVAARIGAGGGRVRTWVADVADEAAVERVFSELDAEWGRCDALVNNAAIYVKGEIADLSLADWERSHAVNVRGTFLCARAAFRRMRDGGRGGAIVNLSSLGGIPGTEKFPGTAAYVTTKFAVAGLTESLAVEGRPHSIRVNCLAPGAVETRMLREAAPFLKTNTRPADVARLIAFLVDSAQSGALTGAVIPIHSNA